MLTLTLVVMIMPAAALVLPIFLELNAMHLIGNVLSVILPFSFFPFGVYLAYLYYSTAIPRDLLDAARLDGCGEWSTFRHIALPLAMPVVALVLFFSFVVGLEQLLPALHRAGRLLAVPDPGRPLDAAVLDARRSTRRSAAAVSRSASSGPSWPWPPCSPSSRWRRLHAVAACAGARAGRWRGEGMTSGSRRG